MPKDKKEKKEKLKTIDIQGKSYVMVHERLTFFRENYAAYALVSEILSNSEGRVVFKATILTPDGMAVATGHAMEKEGEGFINKTSHIENAETSAWGRALANFGIGVDDSVASADEVVNAVKGQESEKKKPHPMTKKLESKETIEETANRVFNVDTSDPLSGDLVNPDIETACNLINTYATKHGVEAAKEVLYEASALDGEGWDSKDKLMEDAKEGKVSKARAAIIKTNLEAKIG